jgi:hypothetical protein
VLRTHAHQLAVRIPAPGVRAARVAARRRVREPRRDVQDPHAAQRGHRRRGAHRRRGRAAVVLACERRNLVAGVASVFSTAHPVATPWFCLLTLCNDARHYTQGCTQKLARLAPTPHHMLRVLATAPLAPSCAGAAAAPHCPCRLEPHAYTRLLAVRAQVWRPPQATCLSGHVSVSCFRAQTPHMHDMHRHV